MINIHLPVPHEGQQKVLDSKAKYKILCCGRRFGKSLICHVISIIGMIEKKHIGYVTPSYALGKEFFREILRMIPKNLIKEANLTDKRIELVTGGSITFFSGDTNSLEESVRGRKFHIFIIDEAAKIDNLELVWNDVILSTLMDYDGDAFLVSTPRGKNYFYKLYQKGLNLEGDFESFNYTSYDNPYLPKNAVQKMKDAMSAASFRQEILAIPSENEDNPFDADAIDRNTVENLSKKETKVFGIDVAKYHDFTVIIGLDEDGHMSYFDTFQLSHEATMEKIKQLPWNILKVIDATGAGDVLFELLSKETKGLRSFTFNSKTKPAIMNELIKDVETNQLKYIKPVAKELFSMEMIQTASSYIKYEAQPGCHDDCVMALAIANHFLRKLLRKTEFKLYYC